MKYLIKLYFVYFFIFFCRDLSFALGNENIILRWPSLNIISSILKINNLIGNDFYTNSILNTPLRSTINIFSEVLPKTHLELISAFSISSLLLKSLLPMAIIFLASNITTLILKELKGGGNFNIKDHFSYTFFIGNLIFFISKQSDILKNIFFGTPIALWGFPVELASSRGISLFISLIAINIYFLIKLFRPIDYKLSKNLLTILFIINLTASIIHPISPLFSLVILFLLNLFNKNLISWLNFFVVYCASWIIGVMVILFLYPQGSIDNLDLFRIYIENNHAHHYLPTYYINQILKWKFLICNFLVSIIFILSQKKNKILQGIFTRLLISNIWIITFINLTQLILVEIYKKPLFIKLGLTFLNISYNFLYFVSILLFFSLNKINFRGLLNNIFEIKIIKFRLIDLLFISLSICTLTLSSSVYGSNIVKIKNSMPYITFNKINFLKKDNSEFIIDPKLAKDLKYPRELGLINIFNDNYFPYNIESLKLWERKSLDFKKLENCLKSDKSKCNLPIQYSGNIFYISSNKQSKLGKEIFNEKIKNISIFINMIDKE